LRFYVPSTLPSRTELISHIANATFSSLIRTIKTNKIA